MKVFETFPLQNWILTVEDLRVDYLPQAVALYLHKILEKVLFDWFHPFRETSPYRHILSKKQYIVRLKSDPSRCRGVRGPYNERQSPLLRKYALFNYFKFFLEHIGCFRYTKQSTSMHTKDSFCQFLNSLEVDSKILSFCAGVFR